MRCSRSHNHRMHLARPVDPSARRSFYLPTVSSSVAAGPVGGLAGDAERYAYVTEEGSADPRRQVGRRTGDRQRVVAAVWGDPLLTDLPHDYILLTDRLVLVGVDSGETAGPGPAFPAPAPVSRCEADLIAVRPAVAGARPKGAWLAVAVHKESTVGA